MKDFFESLKKRYHYAMVVFKELVKTDFQLRYQGSFLGMVWSVLKPLMLFAVMYVVFVKFLKFSDGTPTFPISLLCGTCLWSFFSESTSMGMRAIVDRGDLLRKIHFPNYIIVASTTMGSMISLGINLGVVILFGFFAHAHYTWRILLVPLSIIQLYCLGLGVALLLGSLYVYFRDVAHIWEVVLQAMFYATPIIYPISMVAQNKEFSWAADILMLNPTTQTIMDIRHNLLSPEYVPTVWTMVDNKLLCLLPYVLSAVILWLGIHVFRKYSAKFAEVLCIMTENNTVDERPVVLKVEHVAKSFRLPTEQATGLKMAFLNWTKGIKGYTEQHVLRDINFEVHQGDFFGIVGRNGSGKSTLLKIISQIYVPEQGSVMVKG